MILSSAKFWARVLTPQCVYPLRPSQFNSHSLAQVVHAIYPATEQEYAIKILDKGHLKRVNKTQTAIAEKNTLVRLGSGHPGIVRLHWAFHDEWSLCTYTLMLHCTDIGLIDLPPDFVLDLAKNGELQSRISRLGSLSLPCARYYTAQLVDAVAYMHSRGVIHRYDSGAYRYRFSLHL